MVQIPAQIGYWLQPQPAPYSNCFYFINFLKAALSFFTSQTSA